MNRDITQKYNEISKKYQEILTCNKYYNRITAKFCNITNGKILDAGCGNGYITNLLFQKNKSVMGIDISRGMIQEAKKYYPKISFRQMDMISLKFNNNIFNGIFCFQSFMHIRPQDQRKVFAEFNRILKSNGILFLNTYNRLHPIKFLNSILNKIKYPNGKFGEIAFGGKTKTYRYFSKFNDIYENLEKSGFKINEHNSHIYRRWIHILARKNN